MQPIETFDQFITLKMVSSTEPIKSWGVKNELVWKRNMMHLEFNCSDPLEGGGTIYSTGFFFVPWIFAARYIHRRELRLVSLESSSSVEYGIKKIFLIFVFYRELSRLKLLRKEEWIHVVFIHIFRNFCLNFRQFC